MAEANGSSRISLSRKRHGIVVETIDQWQQADIIDQTMATRLLDTLAITPFDRQRTARYAFIISIICLIIAISAVLADQALMQLLMRLFHTPAIVKSAAFIAIAAALFRYGLVLRRLQPNRPYRNEAIFFLGVLALAAAVTFFGIAMDLVDRNYPMLFLLASVLYGLLGLWFPSKLVWVFGLLSLGTWMGTETGYLSGDGAYFLGMNYPLRFVIFGASLTALGLAGDRASTAARSHTAARLLSMSPQTKVIGLLNLFIALWIMSIFGNYGDLMKWQDASRYALLHWSLLFGAAAIAAIAYGLKRDDATFRGFGLTFLFINLYTRFFEYFWDSLHKAIFFALLAGSFWYLGSRAERIWHFGQDPHRSNAESRSGY